MISINIIAVGNLKERFWKEASEEYQKRLSKFCKLKVIELPEQNKYEDTDKILQIEGQEILKAVKDCGGKTYLLAIDGREYSSENLSQTIMQDSMTNSTINFVIGGSYGTSQAVQQGIKDKISFGRATYPHNLARIILLEQVYRSFMLAGGGKYHK